MPDGHQKPLAEEVPDKATLERIIREQVQQTPIHTIKGAGAKIAELEKRLEAGGL